MPESRKTAAVITFNNVFYIKDKSVLENIYSIGLKESSTSERINSYKSYLKSPSYEKKTEKYIDSDTSLVRYEDIKKSVVKLDNDLMIVYTDSDYSKVILCGVIKVGEDTNHEY